MSQFAHVSVMFPITLPRRFFFFLLLNVFVWLENRLRLDLEVNIQGFLKGIEF